MLCGPAVLGAALGLPLPLHKALPPSLDCLLKLDPLCPREPLLSPYVEVVILSVHTHSLSPFRVGSYVKPSPAPEKSP